MAAVTAAVEDGAEAMLKSVLPTTPSTRRHTSGDQEATEHNVVCDTYDVLSCSNVTWN